jgi:hypothetical protein
MSVFKVDGGDPAKTKGDCKVKVRKVFRNGLCTLIRSSPGRREVLFQLSL